MKKGGSTSGRGGGVGGRARTQWGVAGDKLVDTDDDNRVVDVGAAHHSGMALPLVALASWPACHA